MIVEHVFVTTLESSDALCRAGEFLRLYGFTRQPSPEPLPREGTPAGSTVVRFARGRKTPQRAKSIAELRQEVQIEWLRGRVTVAASIDTAERSFWTNGERNLSPDSPKAKLHVELLKAIVVGLELLLAGQMPLDAAASGWNEVEYAVAEAARKQRRKRRLIWYGCLLGLVLFVGLLVLVAQLHSH